MSSSYAKLKAVGLSKIAIKCYASLSQDGSANAYMLAERLKLSRTGIYRVLKDLEQKGFVVGIKTDQQPTYFYATPVEKALELQADYSKRLLHNLIVEQKASLDRLHQAR